MEWFQNHPVVVILGIASSVISVAGVFWAVAKWVPALRPYMRLPGGRARRWMNCRFCQGTGKFVASQVMGTTTYNICRFCKGHGQIFTDLWAQPDCVHCHGRGMVITREVMGTTEWPIAGCAAGTASGRSDGRTSGRDALMATEGSPV